MATLSSPPLSERSSAASFWCAIACVIFAGFLLPTLWWRMVEDDIYTAWGVTRDNPEWLFLFGASIQVAVGFIVLLVVLRWQGKRLIDAGLRLVPRALCLEMMVVSLVIGAAWILCFVVETSLIWSLELTGSAGNWMEYFWDVLPLARGGRNQDSALARDLDGWTIELTLSWLLALVAYPVLEEIGFRGVVYSWVCERHSLRMAVLLSAAGFAAMEHIAYLSWGHSLQAFVFSIALAFCFTRYNSVLSCLVVRIMHSGFLLLYDF